MSVVKRKESGKSDLSEVNNLEARNQLAESFRQALGVAPFP
jgi:hypothetical protein